MFAPDAYINAPKRMLMAPQNSRPSLMNFDAHELAKRAIRLSRMDWLLRLNRAVLCPDSVGADALRDAALPADS